MILPEGIGVPVHQTRMLSHIMGLSLTGDDQAVLSYEGKGFWWTKCIQKTWQKDPNTTYHLAPAPCFPLLCLLSILPGTLTLWTGRAFGVPNFDAGLRDRKRLSQIDQ